MIHGLRSRFRVGIVNRVLSVQRYSSKSSTPNSSKSATSSEGAEGNENLASNGKSNEWGEKKEKVETKEPKEGADIRTEEKKVKGRRSYVVPQVPSTDYVPRADLETEGLFAGYKPLFLGNSPLETSRNDVLLDGLFSSIRKLKNAQINSESNTVEIDVSDMLDDLKKDNREYQKLHEKVPKIPWDASISGLVYNDQPFKGVPRSVVSKLKPFKLVKVEKKQPHREEELGKKIKLRFHGPRIKDEPTMVDLTQEAKKSRQNTNPSDLLMDSQSLHARNRYEASKVDFAYKFNFIEEDQRMFKHKVSKLTRLFAKEFMKVREIRLASDFKDNHLPLYIYIDYSGQSRAMLKRHLRRKMINYVSPLLMTLSHSYETKEQFEKFKGRVYSRIESISALLLEYIPSIRFKDPDVDCVISPSPVKGFGRIHWLKPTKRHNVFWGKNISNDYVFSLNYDVKVSRSGIRRMKYPVNLNTSSFDFAFSKWKCYDLIVDEPIESR